MFSKYASNLLQNVYNECMLKSFACADEQLASLYRNIARRVDDLIRRININNTHESKNK